MPALQLTGFGEPAEVVTLVTQPALVAGGDEVLVALEAATVHPSDIHLIRGFYGVKPQPPGPLGAEGVGKVVEVGPGADQALLGAASRSCRPTSRGRGLIMPSLSPEM